MLVYLSLTMNLFPKIEEINDHNYVYYYYLRVVNKQHLYIKQIHSEYNWIKG